MGSWIKTLAPWCEGSFSFIEFSKSLLPLGGLFRAHQSLRLCIHRSRPRPLNPPPRRSAALLLTQSSSQTKKSAATKRLRKPRLWLMQLRSRTRIPKLQRRELKNVQRFPNPSACPLVGKRPARLTELFSQWEITERIGRQSVRCGRIVRAKIPRPARCQPDIVASRPTLCVCKTAMYVWPTNDSPSHMFRIKLSEGGFVC